MLYANLNLLTHLVLIQDDESDLRSGPVADLDQLAVGADCARIDKMISLLIDSEKLLPFTLQKYCYQISIQTTEI